MNILSLFDGMSCGQIALNRAEIKYDNYFASEIEKKAILVTQKNYPDTQQLGSVTDIHGVDLPKIDLLLGGSPCQDLSKAKTSGAGLKGAQSGLFWEFIRLKKETSPSYFLFENVVMKKEWSDIITAELGVEPIAINSNLVSAQNRKRLYWTNIPNVGQPKDKGITFEDVVYDDTYKLFTDDRITKTKRLTKNYVQWDICGKGYKSQQDRAYYRHKKVCTIPKTRTSSKMNIVMDLDKDIYRRLHPIEIERGQTVPDNYTEVEGVSINQRMEMVGNGWTVDVIAHILKSLPF